MEANHIFEAAVKRHDAQVAALGLPICGSVLAEGALFSSAGLMMGGWQLATSLGNKLSGVLATMWDRYDNKDENSSCWVRVSQPWAGDKWGFIHIPRIGQEVIVDFIGGEGLLMAPTVAVSRLLQRNGLSFADFDLFEIHEAFAAQALCTLAAFESDGYCRERLALPRALGVIDRGKLNIAGGSLAIGHPFAATGARMLAGAAKLLKDIGGGRVLITACAAGGMGVAAIVERR